MYQLIYLVLLKYLAYTRILMCPEQTLRSCVYQLCFLWNKREKSQEFFKIQKCFYISFQLLITMITQKTHHWDSLEKLSWFRTSKYNNIHYDSESMFEVSFCKIHKILKTFSYKAVLNTNFSTGPNEHTCTFLTFHNSKRCREKPVLYKRNWTQHWSIVVWQLKR